VQESLRGPDINDDFKIGQLHEQQATGFASEQVAGFKSEISGRLNLGVERWSWGLQGFRQARHLH
jgi:hypothetical protein